MDVNDAHYIEVQDASQVGEAGRKLLLIATEIGLDQKTIDRIAIVSSELCSNLVKHAKGGFFVAQGIVSKDNVGLEILALDKGKGMANVANCLEDGFTTAGTMGTGLGAISRMSDTFDIHSVAAKGTVIRISFWLKKPIPEFDRISGFSVPIKGEQMSGDKWKVCPLENGFYCLVVDGLGHGIEAFDAAQLAVKRFRENLDLKPAAMIKLLHQSLRGSRGAVGAVARVDFALAELSYAGLGNIGGIIVSNRKPRHLTSLNGTLGYESRTITEFKLPWTANSTLIMHSDGLSSKLSQELESLDCQQLSAGIIAGSLFLHYAKRSDDATVMVAKQIR